MNCCISLGASCLQCSPSPLNNLLLWCYFLRKGVPSMQAVVDLRKQLQTSLGMDGRSYSCFGTRMTKAGSTGCPMPGLLLLRLPLYRQSRREGSTNCGSAFPDCSWLRSNGAHGCLFYSSWETDPWYIRLPAQATALRRWFQSLVQA